MSPRWCAPPYSSSRRSGAPEPELPAGDREVPPTALRALAVHRRAAVGAGRLQRADDQAERHRLDLDRNVRDPVERLAVHRPFGGSCLRVERDLTCPELTRLVDRDERRLDGVAERAALWSHSG